VLALALAVLAVPALGWEAVVAPSLVLWIRVGPLPRTFAWITAEVESYGSSAKGHALANGGGGSALRRAGRAGTARTRGSIVRSGPRSSDESGASFSARGSGWRDQLECSASPWVDQGLARAATRRRRIIPALDPLSAHSKARLVPDTRLSSPATSDSASAGHRDSTDSDGLS
jgi:hypothetical protein